MKIEAAAEGVPDPQRVVLSDCYVRVCESDNDEKRTEEANGDSAGQRIEFNSASEANDRTQEDATPPRGTRDPAGTKGENK